VAPGIDLYHSTERSLIDPEGPISIWMLRIDPAKCEMRAALANDEIVGTEAVADIATRHEAVAAVNAGFFLPNGDPQGVLTLDRRLVSDTRRARGAVGLPASGGDLVFARLRASAALVVQGRGGVIQRVPVDGVDTTRARGRIMIFTPAYHEDTDTADGGLEWVVSGTPPRVVSAARKGGRTPIPRDGFVVSFGGLATPPALAALKRGTRVSLEIAYEPLEGPVEPWQRARDIVGGAGLLIRDGEEVADWTVEQFSPGFATNRHPRTMIGVRADGSIWLVTVDGRQPQLSAGMTLEELRSLARRLELTNALNLDGGGSTTMWVQGEVVNSPSDLTGPRKVSDALLVFPRGESRGAPPTTRASTAGEPRDRSAPAQRRARARVGESEGRSPSVER
jgi:exopolysaccharide biosynthesis protein